MEPEPAVVATRKQIRACPYCSHGTAVFWFWRSTFCSISKCFNGEYSHDNQYKQIDFFHDFFPIGFFRSLVATQRGTVRRALCVRTSERVALNFKKFDGYYILIMLKIFIIGKDGNIDSIRHCTNQKINM